MAPCKLFAVEDFQTLSSLSTMALMIVYNDTTIAFIQRSEVLVKDILFGLGLQVKRSRFLWNNYFYPIHIVVFEGNELGHFNAPYLQIALNKKLIYSAKDSVLRDILKHELAHYLTYLRHGEVRAHGKEFHDICREFNFPEEIAAATMNLDERNLSHEGDLVSERIIEKVKKLLLLAQSSNPHEAELATLKANELLLRHNLDHLKGSTQETIYLDRVLTKPRKEAKLTAIYEILRHFIVRPVLSFGKGECSLEVSGSLTNVKLARYVAEFLDRELDRLWEVVRGEEGLQGLRAKNSFFAGVAKGFDEKMKMSKAGFSAEDQKSLVVVEKKLDQDVRMIYRRLSTSTSGAKTDERARNAGVDKGRNLTIRQGVEGKGKKLYLPFGKS